MAAAAEEGGSESAGQTIQSENPNHLIWRAEATQRNRRWKSKQKRSGSVGERAESDRYTFGRAAGRGRVLLALSRRRRRTRSGGVSI